MKKTIIALAIGLFINNSYAVSAAGHSSSAHAVASEAHVTTIAPHIAVMSSSIAASSAARAQAMRAAQNQQNNTATQFNPEVSKGVLHCKAYTVREDSDANQYQSHENGCAIYTGTFSADREISIEDYFKLHKPIDATHITMVIYNSTNDKFEIYYA